MVTRVPALGMLSLAFPSQATFAFLKPASWLGLLPQPPLPLHNPTPSRFSDRPRRPAPPPPDPPSPPRPPLSHRTPCHFQQRAMLKRACAFIYTLLLPASSTEMQPRQKEHRGVAGFDPGWSLCPPFRRAHSTSYSCSVIISPPPLSDTQAGTNVHSCFNKKGKKRGRKTVRRGHRTSSRKADTGSPKPRTTDRRLRREGPLGLSP